MIYQAICKSICSLAIVCLATLACPSRVSGDGLLDDVDGLAEDYLVAYIAGRTNLSGNAAFIGRGFATSLRKSISEVREVEIWALEAYQTGEGNKNSRLSAMCRQEYKNGFSPPPLWEQTLETDGQRFYRRTMTGTIRGMNRSEKDDTEEDKSVTRRSMPKLDPYFLPFVDTAAYLRSKDGKAFAERFLSRCELMSAKRQDGGVLGVWSLTSDSPMRWKISLLFDPKQGNMPARVDWEYGLAKNENEADDRGQSNNDFRSQMSSRTSWDQIESKQKDGKSIKGWVPKRISRVDSYSGDDFTETIFFFQWKQSDRTMFPKPEDDDWREPFAEAFVIDWSESFQSFSRRLDANTK
ncbi:hypothetical protein [Novipirellula rosea]|uniref:Secreted protein n=1 Tax=Novipirellula rosea TaxID=1031540 RepID=A0ABP8NNL4_9BACT